MKHVARSPRMLEVVLLLCAAVLMVLPALWFPMAFDEDKGIEYQRSFVVTWNQVTAQQVRYTDGYTKVTETCNILPLRYLAIGAAIWCIALACWRGSQYRQWPCYVAFAAVVGYYGVLAWYMMHISSDMTATIRPQWTVLTPALAALALRVIARNHLGAVEEEDGEAEADGDYTRQNYPDIFIVK